MSEDINLQKEKSSLPARQPGSGDFLQLLEAMGQGVVYQSAAGEIIAANKSAERILGLPANELLGRRLTDPIWELTLEDGTRMEEDQHPAEIALQTGKIISNMVMGIYQQKNKQYCRVKVTAKPEFLTENNKPHQVCIVFLDITEQNKVELKLKKRVRELQAFYSLSTIVETENTTFDILCQRVINILPESWQYPSVACGRITINGREFATGNFSKTAWKLSAPIQLNKTVIGSVEIYYLDERPPADEGPFLHEERLLLNSITERIGRIAEREYIIASLHKSNANYRLISENVNDLIWAMDFETQKFTYISPSVLKLRGYTTMEMMQQSMAEVLTPESFEKAVALLTKHLPNFLNGKSVGYEQIELEQYRKDGTIAATEVSTTLAYDDKGKVQVIGISRDITERKRAEAALRQTEKIRRALLEAITESVLLIEPDGTGIMANSETFSRLKINQEQFEHYSIFDLLPSDVAAYRQSKVAEVVQTRLPIRFEDSLFGRNILNSIIPIFNQEGNVSQLAIFGFDITDHKKAGEEIRRLSHVIEQMADTVIITDVEGSIEYVNPSFEKLTGYLLSEVLGKTPRILKSGVQSAPFYKDMWETILNGKVFKGEFNNKKKSGELYFEMTTITPVKNSQGQLTHFIATGKDTTDRKQAEEKLLISEHRNKAIVDTIPDLLFRVKRDGTFLDYSSKSTDKLYAPPEMFIDKNIAEVLPGEVARQSFEAINQAFEQNALQTFEYTLTMNREPRIFESRVVANLNEQEVAVIVRDITEQKELELALKQQLKEFETINKLSRAMRAGKNLKELLGIILNETLSIVASTDGCILLLDPINKHLDLAAGSSWFQSKEGYSVDGETGIAGHVFKVYEPYISADLQNDELISDRLRDFIPPQSSGIFLPIRSENDTLGILFIVFPLPRVITENESRLLVIISQLSANAISRSRLHDQVEIFNFNLKEEINQKVITQKMLAAEKELLSTTLMSIAEGVIITDKEGTIMLYNRAAETLTGFEAFEVIGHSLQNFFQIIDPFTRQVIQSPVHNLYKMDWAQENNLEYKPPLLITKSGERILVAGSIALIKSQAGEQMGHVIVFQDITEKHRAETQLLLSQKMEAIGQLAAGIAHEINTPIQYVGDNLRFLQKMVSKFAEILNAYQNATLETAQPLLQETIDDINNLSKKNKIQSYLQESPVAIEEALDGVERVRKIVMAMREFSHPSEKKKKPADINHGIETTIVISRNEWKYFAELDTDLDPELPMVNCQIDEINQVILNMIVNASQSIQEKMPAGSEQKGRISIRTQRANSKILISIQDTGKGIPEDIRMRIFEPFFTTKGIGKGTGQGLSMAHNIIVKKHHGMIKVDSILDQGSTFTIELPIDTLNKES